MYTMIRLKSLLESALPPTGQVTKQLFDYLLSQVEAEALETAHKTWNEFTPKECNNGWCDLFADKLQSFLPGSVIWETKDSGMGTYGHVWIEWKDKYYDSETLHGVSNWQQLPWMNRFYKTKGNYPEVAKLS